jgi:hypothetical protein
MYGEAEGKAGCCGGEGTGSAGCMLTSPFFSPSSLRSSARDSTPTRPSFPSSTLSLPFVVVAEDLPAPHVLTSIWVPGLRKGSRQGTSPPLPHHHQGSLRVAKGRGEDQGCRRSCDHHRISFVRGDGRSQLRNHAISKQHSKAFVGVEVVNGERRVLMGLSN